MTPPNHRNELGAWLNERGLVGSMAEIGCAFGGFAKVMLSNWKGSQYVMIDPWITQDPSIYKERQEEAWTYERWFEECSEIAASDPRVSIVRKHSSDAVNDFDDCSFSCVYLDGNHSLEHVRQDLADWWPKVKPGGLFSGHDYYDCVTEGYHNLVKSAVDEWATRNSFSAATTPCSSWWITKPPDFK